MMKAEAEEPKKKAVFGGWNLEGSFASRQKGKEKAVMANQSSSPSPILCASFSQDNRFFLNLTPFNSIPSKIEFFFLGLKSRIFLHHLLFPFLSFSEFGFSHSNTFFTHYLVRISFGISIFSLAFHLCFHDWSGGVTWKGRWKIGFGNCRL